VRGPFDIVDRMALNNPASSALESSITRPSSPMVATFNGYNRNFLPRSNSIITYLHYDNHSRGTGVGNSNNNLLGDRSGVLLNKEREDLCWDCLFMVCGGTGIAPMLQLVSYKL
jgi:hypothetical protein